MPDDFHPWYSAPAASLRHRTQGPFDDPDDHDDLDGLDGHADPLDRLTHLVFLDGRLLDAWTEPADGTRWEHVADRRDRERRPVAPPPPPPPGTRCSRCGTRHRSWCSARRRRRRWPARSAACS